jgi:hypothetical protein
MQNMRNWGLALVISVGIGAGIGMAPTQALAADEDETVAAAGEEGVVYKKKTTVSFDDDTIDGDLTKPDADYLDVRKRLRHSNLIKIRENFREKILNSLTAI